MIAVAALVLLQACGGAGVDNSSGNGQGGLTQGFDDGLRTAFREKFVAECVKGAQTTSHSTIDFTPICACSADKLMAGKSATQMLTGPTPKESEAAIGACVKEHPLASAKS